jgi:hypothetical protein
MRQHYTPLLRPRPLAGVALACAIGFALAYVLVAWWSS